MDKTSFDETYNAGSWRGVLQGTAVLFVPGCGPRPGRVRAPQESEQGSLLGESASTESSYQERGCRPSGAQRAVSGSSGWSVEGPSGSGAA